MGAEMISVEWLQANGFKQQSPRHGVTNGDHYCRWIADEKIGGLMPFESFDDLGIELAFAGEQSGWFCWIVKAESRQIIHVRYMSLVAEVISLWEGLAGERWPH